jgi:hypothetical protein
VGAAATTALDRTADDGRHDNDRTAHYDDHGETHYDDHRTADHDDVSDYTEGATGTADDDHHGARL